MWHGKVAIAWVSEEGKTIVPPVKQLEITVWGLKPLHGCSPVVLGMLVDTRRLQTPIFDEPTPFCTISCVSMVGEARLGKPGLCCSSLKTGSSKRVSLTETVVIMLFALGRRLRAFWRP